MPTLVVISGPPGAGKTTLAHEIAKELGCPAICRDEIKEGMVHATPGFVPAAGDPLSVRTLPVFFGVLEQLLRAGVTTVAEAAFQNRLWRPGLEPLRGLAQLRVVHCVTAADVAWTRRQRRSRENPVRRAHPDPRPGGPAGCAAVPGVFDRVSIDAPWIEVDTTDGYRPRLAEVIAFINGPGSR